MKRKLDVDDVPPRVGLEPADVSTFQDLKLDSRLLQGLSREKFTKPTPVQCAAIPLALEGKDILARAKTGSGKTLAYILPILQSILRKKAVAPTTKLTSALILVPTRELADQVYRVISAYSAFCAQDVRSVNLTQRVSDAVQRSILANAPDVVIATPARTSQCLNNSALSLQNLAHVVLDEADLVLSYGYDEDIDTIAKAMPHGVQAFLMSATLTAEVDLLKDLFCRNPALLKLDDQEGDDEGVSQFVVKCAEDEKFLLTYVIFKLQLIKGKCIIFVGDVDRSYRLKLFLEQFGIRSCVLNSELPVNSRLHVVQEFNKNVYDIIIAADEQEVIGGVPSVKKAPDPPPDAADEMNPDAGAAVQPRKRRKQSGKERDFGVSRGIDFHNVACVLNFDLPTTSKSYTHRIGRTARAGKTGMALSFVVPAEQYGKHKSTSLSSTKQDEAVLEKITERQGKKGKVVKPYHFDMKQVDAFRYRMGDALRAVTRTAVREARARELRQELIKSEKLRKHFEENPDDLRHLRHDGELRGARVQAHLKHIPSYLMPSKGAKGIASDDIGFVGPGKRSENRIRKARTAKKSKGKSTKAGARKVDPLKTFKTNVRK